MSGTIVVRQQRPRAPRHRPPVATNTPQATDTPVTPSTRRRCDRYARPAATATPTPPPGAAADAAGIRRLRPTRRLALLCASRLPVPIEATPKARSGWPSPPSVPYRSREHLRSIRPAQARVVAPNSIERAAAPRRTPRRRLLCSSPTFAGASTPAAYDRRAAIVEPAEAPMTTTSELCMLSLEDLAQLIAFKEVSPVEATQAVLDRIERLEPAAQQLHHGHRRAGARRGARRRARDRRRRVSRAAARRAHRDQGPLRDEGRAHDGRLEDPRRLGARLRRDRRRKLARRARSASASSACTSGRSAPRRTTSHFGADPQPLEHRARRPAARPAAPARRPRPGSLRDARQRHRRQHPHAGRRSAAASASCRRTAAPASTAPCRCRGRSTTRAR